MNDMILNDRQKEILRFLQSGAEMSSTGLYERFGDEWRVKKLTVIRDLNSLLKGGFICSEGKARKTVYKAKSSSDLLWFIDLKDYFGKPISERKGFDGFQESVIGKFSGVFGEEEVKDLKKNSKEFSRRMKLFNETLFKREFERFIIEFSWKSAQIEGNTYDLLETEALIKMKIEARGHSSKEAAMILNHKAALEEVMRKPGDFKTLSVAKVKKLHKLLVKDLDVDVGVRKRAVRITGTCYIPPKGNKELERILKDIVEQINKVNFPPEKALIASSMIAYLQPFADGNKRTARILGNAILLAHGYFPPSYRSVHPTDYIKAMILFYEQNNLYHLKKIFVEQMAFSMENYFVV